MTSVKEIMSYRSFEKAKLITGEMGVGNEVNGVMVMEAPDIESWGREGLMILTSYFAMEDVSRERIALFFEHAKKIGISAIVVKIDRLVNEIPEVFIDSCGKYQIPLFQIDKSTTYEKIITEVLETIINRNAYVLQNFYDVHKQFTRLMMRQPEIPEILQTLKQLLKKPVSLLELPRNRMIGTDAIYDDFEILDTEVQNAKKHLNLSFTQNAVRYASDPNHIYKQLVVQIPNLSYEKFYLIIHERNRSSDDVDLMAIENAVTALQIELLTRYTIRQNNQSRLNEMASDLLHGRLSKQEDIDDTIFQLGLDHTRKYRVILVNFDSEVENTQEENTLAARFSDAIIAHSRIAFTDRVYVTRKNKVILIAPSDKDSIEETKQKIRLATKDLLKLDMYSHFNLYTTISNDVTLSELSIGYRQAVDAQKVLQLTGSQQVVSSYQDMGIYQIFVETGNFDSLQRFIPENILRLQKENPELLKTLHTFIDLNQNYTETAQRLYIHPKTVRYRIDRLKEVYHIDLESPEEILRYSIGFRLLNFIGDDRHDGHLRNIHN